MNEVGMRPTLQERAGYLDINGNESYYVEIDMATRDGGTAGGNASTELLPGLVLGKLTTGGRYTDYDQDGTDGSQLEENCVILLEPVDDISTGHQRAHVAPNGVVRAAQLRWATAGDKTAFEFGKASFAAI